MRDVIRGHPAEAHTATGGLFLPGQPTLAGALGHQSAPPSHLVSAVYSRCNGPKPPYLTYLVVD